MTNWKGLIGCAFAAGVAGLLLLNGCGSQERGAVEDAGGGADAVGVVTHDGGLADAAGDGGARDAAVGDSASGARDASLDGGASIDAGTVADGAAATDAACGQLADGGYVWPNSCSRANSDPWLSQHQDEVVEEHPVALLLDFVNTFTTYEGVNAPVGYDIDTIVQPLIQKHVDAFRVASTYHGYNDATAQPFKTYSVLKMVDARDASGQQNSALLPLQKNGTSVDYSQFTSQTWTDRIAIDDPAAPGTHLSICQLFEKGIIHEVWGMVADPATAKFDESAETKQSYDASNKPIAGKMSCVSNGQCIQQAVPCKVSTRFYDFNPDRGPGCHLHANGHAWENYITRGALPAFAKVASTFFNMDFATRFNAPFGSFYDVCPYTADVCIQWTTPSGGPFTAATSGPASSQSFGFSDLTQGCGNVHFPPNATTQYIQLDGAYDATHPPASAPADVETLSSCEHYGLHDGSGGRDQTTPFSNALIAQRYAATMGASADLVATDCGGPQPSYLFASMPGLGNVATAADGTPMHNWWVYEFY